MEGYKRYYDSIEPSVSDEELLKAVLDRKAEKKMSDNKHRINIWTAVAAAAVMFSVGVTAAGVSCKWDFTKLFEGFFSQTAAECQGYVDTGIEKQTITADLSQMGINLDRTVDFGCGSVTFTAAVADSNTVMVMYDLNIDSEVLNEYCGKNGEIPCAVLGFEDNPVGCNFSDGFGFDSSVENKSYGTNASYCSRTNRYCFQDGYLTPNTVLELEFNSLTLFAGDNSRQEIEPEESITLSLPLDFMNTQRIEVSPNAEITLDNYRYTLDDVVITPLCIQWYARREEKIGKTQGETSPIVYCFKDGTEIRNYQITETSEYNGEREFFAILLDKPINPNDLVSVTIGDFTITL